MQSIIKINKLELIYSGQILFENFSYMVSKGERIAIIGDNGSGKSSLLKLLAACNELPISGISSDESLAISYVPQIITEYEKLSGGQRFNRVLSNALARYPDVLLLDEPTNHLDHNNRKSLLSMLKHSFATLIVVSHDRELLELSFDTLWHIHDGEVSVFHGRYSDYLTVLAQEKGKLERQVGMFDKVKKKQHLDLMKEQQRAKTSRGQGEKSITNRKWPTITSGAKARRAEITSGKKNSILNREKALINQQIKELWQSEELNYRFTLPAMVTNKVLVSVNDGKCRYFGAEFELANINFTLEYRQRLAIRGSNGSGKSTLVQAIMGNPLIEKKGEWVTPLTHQIAYLDQHYSTLPQEGTVIGYILDLAPDLSYLEIRDFLNKFLFRKNEEVEKPIEVLSGGEKARLSFAIIALQEPKLLILDEITNNIDLRTRTYITNLLKNYPGALVVISHDRHFLDEIGITCLIELG